MKSFIVSLMLLTSTLGFAGKSDAVYEVPGGTGDEGLYEMSFKLEVAGDQVWTRYDLPKDLTGNKNRIEAEGTWIAPQIAVLNGPKSQLTCNFELKKCDVKYKDLSIDLDVVKARLEAQGLPTSQIESRLAISRRFSDDPIGIIHF